MKALEAGTVMFKFRRKRPPEKRIFTLKLATFEIQQTPFPSRGRAIAEDTGKREELIHKYLVTHVAVIDTHYLFIACNSHTTCTCTLSKRQRPTCIIYIIFFMK